MKVSNSSSHKIPKEVFEQVIVLFFCGGSITVDQDKTKLLPEAKQPENVCGSQQLFHQKYNLDAVL